MIIAIIGWTPPISGSTIVTVALMLQNQDYINRCCAGIHSCNTTFVTPFAIDNLVYLENINRNVNVIIKVQSI